jgi:hypothetical protein
MAFGVVAGSLTPPALPSEFNLGSVALTVSFRRKPAKRIRERYAQMVGEWATSVTREGIFGEGPIILLSRDVEFQGLRAQLRIDARRSGQHSLNWFALKALCFALEISPLTAIVMANDESLDRVCPAVGEVTKVAFQGRSASNRVPDQPGQIDELVSRLPTDCSPHAEPRCKLRLFKRPHEEWDDWRVGVYFTLQPDRDQQQGFADLIKAWQTVAEFWGFGKPIDRFKGLHFDQKTESAYFEADMGSAEPGLAVPLLLRILEGFDAAVLPIDAVVFGKAEFGREG